MQTETFITVKLSYNGGLDVLEEAAHNDTLLTNAKRDDLSAAIERILDVPGETRRAMIARAVKEQDERWKLIFPLG